MASLMIAERDFVIEASRDRVWRLIGKVIFSSLPNMENVEILDENNFRALLRMKIPGLGLNMKLRGEMVDMSPPESFGVRLALEGPGGLLQINQKVNFAMVPVENRKTSVTCKATAQNMGFFFRLFVMGQARHFANSTFEAIEKRLQELA